MNHSKVTPVFTIGYGARSLEELIAVLQEHGIAYLVDVRSAPYSRYKPDFSQDTLEAALKRHGIRYIFMGDSLGGQPNEPDCYVNGKVDYELVKIQSFFQRGIERLLQAATSQQRLVLMCSEGKPELCHRSKLIGEVLEGLDIPVAHIDEKDELISQEGVIHRITGGQLSLFGSHTFTSRKRYSSK
jgi:uncharacterized protein (DUF488 family)